LRRAQRADNTAAVLKLLAVSYYGLKQHRLFVETMEEARKKAPEDWAPYYYLGRYYDSDRQEFGEAERLFREALKRKPDHARAMSYLGYCLEMSGRRAEAAEQYRKAIALAEKSGLRFSHPYQRLALLLVSEDAQGALVLARKAMDVGPAEAANHKALAQAEAELGDWRAAIRAWTEAARLDPTDASVRYRLYRAHLAAGDQAAAEQALDEYREISALYGTTK
jgi:tetratricopeptide (TPR) repeat protein